MVMKITVTTIITTTIAVVALIAMGKQQENTQVAIRSTRDSLNLMPLPMRITQL